MILLKRTGESKSKTTNNQYSWNGSEDFQCLLCTGTTTAKETPTRFTAATAAARTTPGRNHLLPVAITPYLLISGTQSIAQASRHLGHRHLNGTNKLGEIFASLQETIHQSTNVCGKKSLLEDSKEEKYSTRSKTVNHRHICRSDDTAECLTVAAADEAIATTAADLYRIVIWKKTIY